MTTFRMRCWKARSPELKTAGVSHDIITVPGALEIPAAVAIALDAAEGHGKPYDAVIALVWCGATPSISKSFR